jgi:hypothetical protein
VIAFKFLRAGAVGPFTRFQWPATGWVEAPQAREGYGVHACRASDLAWWISDELWRVELDGPAYERETQIEARRGRLLDRVAAWDAAARAEFGLACVFQARDVAAAALRELRFPAIADRLAAARTLQELAATAGSIEAPAGFAGEMFGYARDASLAYSTAPNPAEVSFMASVATAAARGSPAAFDAEKRRQSRWLVDRLALANEGEGSKSADKQYRQGATDFAKRTDTLQRGLEAEREVEHYRDEYERAEEKGKAHSAGDLQSDLSGKNDDKT